MNIAMQLTENQQLIEQSLHRYLRDGYDMVARAKVIEQGASSQSAHWDFFADMGLLGLPIPEQDGGFGGTLADTLLVARAIGEHLVVEPYIECVVLAGRLLAASTCAVQKSRWLEPLIAGEQMIALAHREHPSGQAGLNTRLLAQDGQWLLQGEKCLVAGLPLADSLLVTAATASGELQVCVVRSSAPGVTVRPYPGIDGRAYAEVSFAQVAVAADAVLELADAGATLREVIDYGDAVLCAEALGIMDALQRLTVDYAKTRKQFGVAIGSFQVLKHRMVDCYNLLYQASVLMELVGQQVPGQWQQHLAAACHFIVEAGVAIGHEAIQIHGGMGVTDELSVSHYHKRLVTIGLLLGKGAFQPNPLAASDGFLAFSPQAVVPVFDSYLDESAKAFRQDVREFVASHMTPAIRAGVRRQVNAFTEPETTGAWLDCLKTKGWQAPHWPVELGGTGWSAMERFVYDYETGLLDVPELVPMAFRYVGPVIAHFGTEWQKSYFLPKILSGEHYWAQGFSEPGAGSDLVALKTTAVRDGDHFVINGSKMWTTHAHHADWLFCLARTDKDARPQNGIGFFLIDMNSPGIRVEPISLMTGPREVNQVFLDDVRVPASHLVGELTKGWEYTKFLLEFERGGAVFCGRARAELNRAKELAVRVRQPLLSSDCFLDRLANLEVRLMALELLEFRHIAAVEAGSPPGVGGSITKLLASELRKDITELTYQIGGLRSVEFHNPYLCDGTVPEGYPGIDLELAAMPRYLNMRAESIYGGSSEVQREIIAKAVLGLR